MQMKIDTRQGGNKPAYFKVTQPRGIFAHANISKRAEIDQQ